MNAATGLVILINMELSISTALSAQNEVDIKTCIIMLFHSMVRCSV